MSVVRIYTGDDGQSHFQEVELPFAPRTGSETTPSQPASGVAFMRYQPGLVQDWHTAPRRQYVVTLSGQVEIQVGDGAVRRFGPGDVLLAEDLTGQGHLTRVVGDEPRTALLVPLVS